MPKRRRSVGRRVRNRWGQFVKAVKRGVRKFKRVRRAQKARRTYRAAKRSYRAARRQYRKARSSMPKRRRAKRNPLTYSKYTTTKSGKSRRTRHVSVRTSRLSKKGRAKLAQLRASGAAYTYEALRGLKRHERRATVAKKHRKSKKSHRKAKRSHASYVKAGRKAARTKARRKAARSRAGKKAHRKTTHRRRTHRRGLRRVTARRGVTFMARPKRGRKYRRYRVRARYPRKLRGRVRFSVRHNPGLSGLKSMLMSGVFMYGGFLAMRVLRNAIDVNVIQKYPTTFGPTTTLGKVAPVLPAAGAFLLGLFAPKFIKNPKIVAGLQTGAALVLFDAVFNTWIKPSIAPVGSTAAKYLAGDGMGFYGGEYIAQRPRLPMMGAVAREAMAMDEYVQQPMGAYDVNEALAGSEVQAMQSGYAGGSLARTLFSV